MGKKKPSKKGAVNSPKQQPTKPKKPNDITKQVARTLAEIKVELS